MKVLTWPGKIVCWLVVMGLALSPSTALTPPATPEVHPVYLPLIVGGKPSLHGQPSWGSPIAVSPSNGEVWVVNPDAGSVSVMDGVHFEKIAEIPVGEEPWSLAIAPDGSSVYVLDRARGTLVVLDAFAKAPQAALSVGAEPGNIALTPGGRRAYITLTASDQAIVVDLQSLDILTTIQVAPRPFGVAVTNDGDETEIDERVYLTHLQAFPLPGSEPGRDDGRAGMVTVLDAGTNQIVQEIHLTPDVHGFPNLLMSITLWGQKAWLPLVRSAPDLPRGLTTTVFAAVSVIDLAHGVEDIPANLPLNDQEIFGSPVNNPVAAIPALDGRTLYIVLAGSNLVEIVDISAPMQPRLVKFLPIGSNPRGLALSPDGHWGYSMNYLSRSVTVLDLEALAWEAEIPVTGETLPPDVLQGKILFNSAMDPRLSQGSWMSCASCHPDGGSDGVTWAFPDGLRQTPPLWNIYQTLPWHWSAALDEAQDVEDTIQRIQHGLGLAPGIDPPLLGMTNLGRSEDLDALAAFLEAGIRTPTMSPPGDVSAGRELFRSAGCAACHGGPNWTISHLPGLPETLDPDGNGMIDDVLIDVGTLGERDLRGASGFDPPSLLNVGLTAPYLHDGSMPDLTMLLASGHPDPQGDGNYLCTAEIEALVRFLRSIGPATPPVEISN